MTQKRKIIQITAAAKSGVYIPDKNTVIFPKTHLFALCDDGDLFELYPEETEGPDVWHRVPKIPETL